MMKKDEAMATMQTITLHIPRPCTAVLVSRPSDTSPAPRDDGAAEPVSVASAAPQPIAPAPTHLPTACHAFCERHSQTIVKALEQQRAATAAMIRQLNSELAEFAIHLAVEIAGAVVQYEVAQHTGRLQRLITQWRETTADDIPLSLYVNRHDLERLRLAFDDSPLATSIKWHCDDTLANGDCRIETDKEHVIALATRQLEDIRSHLMEALRDANSY